MPSAKSAVQHAVLDTNILVSALIRPEGPPGLVMAAVLHGQLVPVLTEEILAEYEQVLQRRRLGLDAAKVHATLGMMRLVSVQMRLEAIPPPAGLPDPADWPFAACAIASGCPVITGNAKHFPKMAGLAVMTAREWVEANARK